MNSFWMMVFNVVFGSIMGGIIANINDGSRMDGVILGLLFIVWFEIRDSKNNEH